VLISLDTVRPDHLGCYGYHRGTSPNIDRMANEGIRFARCYSQAPWTLPSHLSLFTSMLPSHNGVEGINQVLPEQVPTLAEMLQQNGYRTAALVNNGQMRAHWGFDRGFDVWREFMVDTPAGACPNLTSEAIHWLETARAEPFFLFLHYYDAHDPYDPPEEFRRRFGSSLTGAEARRLVWRARGPKVNLLPEQLTEVIGSYDGEIGWLDQELGRLFAKLPDNTLLVLFSDHGEAFEEHGWTLHGATLFEEEVRTLLVMRRPQRLPAGQVIDRGVMLLDVVPTVLGQCGIAVPSQCQGIDLQPLIDGQPVAERLILAETKSVLEGQILKMVVLRHWKLVHSLFDNRVRLYKLPDEHTDLTAKEPALTKVLSETIRNGVAQEDYWMIHARGQGDFEVRIEVRGGQFAVFLPGESAEETRDHLEAAPEGRSLRWTAYPEGGTKMLFLQSAPTEAPLTIDARINGVRVEPQTSEAPPALGKEGIFVQHHKGRSGRAVKTATLDEQTLQQLRSLGYLR
jgi:arylsulfatase A-like enzyme